MASTRISCNCVCSDNRAVAHCLCRCAGRRIRSFPAVFSVFVCWTLPLSSPQHAPLVSPCRRLIVLFSPDTLFSTIYRRALYVDQYKRPVQEVHRASRYTSRHIPKTIASAPRLVHAAYYSPYSPRNAAAALCTHRSYHRLCGTTRRAYTTKMQLSNIRRTKQCHCSFPCALPAQTPEA